jgi:hypothetical protein
MPSLLASVSLTWSLLALWVLLRALGKPLRPQRSLLLQKRLALPKILEWTSPKRLPQTVHFRRFVGQVVSRAPGGGPLQSAVQKAIGQGEQAVGDAAGIAGGRSDAENAGYTFTKAITDYFKPAVRQKLDEAYGRVESLVDKNATSPLSETQGAIADITSRRLASGKDDPGLAVGEVLGGATRPGGLTFQGIKDLRTGVGEMLDTGTFPTGMSQRETAPDLWGPVG